MTKTDKNRIDELFHKTFPKIFRSIGPELQQTVKNNWYKNESFKSTDKRKMIEMYWIYSKNMERGSGMDKTKTYHIGQLKGKETKWDSSHTTQILLLPKTGIDGELSYSYTNSP